MIVLNEKLQPILDTAVAKFQSEIVISIYDNGDLVLELWGASTKHPGVGFSYKNFKASCCMEMQDNIVAWLAQCASNVTFRGNMYRILKMATKKTGNALYRALRQQSKK